MKKNTILTPFFSGEKLLFFFWAPVSAVGGRGGGVCVAAGRAPEEGFKLCPRVSHNKRHARRRRATAPVRAWEPPPPHSSPGCDVTRPSEVHCHPPHSLDAATSFPSLFVCSFVYELLIYWEVFLKMSVKLASLAPVASVNFHGDVVRSPLGVMADSG